MFFGQKDLAIDDKSRLILPSLFRDEFKGGVCYVTLGLDPCLEIYPEEIYKEKVVKFTSLSDFDQISRKLKRTFLSNTFKIEIDPHNRILLPKALLAKTNLNKKVILVGIFDHLELWDDETFLNNSSEAEATFSQDAQELLDK